MKIRIKSLPKAKDGLNYNVGPNFQAMPYLSTLDSMSQPDVSVRKTLQPVDRQNANLEAEKNEVVVEPGDGGIPSLFVVGGSRHSNGGTPLKLKPNSFVFSDTAKMKIKDKAILKQFGESSPTTPAEIAKKWIGQYQKYQKMLRDPNTTELEAKTAEAMMSKYIVQVAKLAIIQESMKGFPSGIPVVAQPYIDEMGIDPAQFAQVNPEPTPEAEEQVMQWGGLVNSLQMRQKGGDTRKVRITALPKAQNGITMPEGTKPKIYGKDNYTVGDYVQFPDGTIKLVEWIPDEAEISEDEAKMLTTKSGDTKPAKIYAQLKKTITKDPKLKYYIHKQYQEAIKKSKYLNYKKDGVDVNKSLRDKLLNKTPDEVLNTLIKGQKHVYALGASGENIKGEDWKNLSTKYKGNTKYNEVINKLGDTPLSDEEVAMFQAAMWGAKDATKQRDKFPEFANNFKVALTGQSDERTIEGEPKLSDADQVWKDTTAGEAIIPTYEGPKFKNVTTPKKDKEDIKYDPGKTKPVYNLPGGAPIWLQDWIKLGKTMGDLASIKNYRPFHPISPDLETPEPTFYDPTREIAAANEMATIMSNTMSNFADPQAYNARMSDTAGKTATNVANIMGRYNNLNVGVANQFADKTAAIKNQDKISKYQSAITAYDKNTIANQQFDNAKRQAKGQVMDQIANMVTNAANAYNLNQMYPQYAVDPSRAGMMYFRPGYDLSADISPDVYKKIQEIKNSDVNMDWDDAIKIYQMSQGVNPELGDVHKKKNKVYGYPGNV